MESKHGDGDSPETDTASQRWCEILDVTPGANANELDLAYERAISLIDGRSVGGYLMLDPSAAQAARDDVERAYAELRKNAAPDEVQDDTPTPSEPKERDAGHYSSGIPRRAMRILSPVAPATAEPSLEDASNASTTPQKSSPPTPTLVARARISIAPAVVESRPSEAPEPASPPADPPHKSLGSDRERLERARSPTLVPQDDLPAAVPPESPAADAAPVEALRLASIPPERAVGEVKIIESTRGPEDEVLEEIIRDVDEVNGGLIRRLRETRGISLEDLAKTTKVQRAVLIAIEDQDLDVLPARVYLRGFLTQIARVLKVDRKRLADGYIDFVERHRSR